LETDLTSEQREFAKTIQTCSNSLLVVINDILDLSKIQAGKIDIEMLDFDLHMLIEKVCDPLVMKINKKGLEYILEIDPEVPSRVRGDPGRLRQILLNLLSNAIKFTSTGEISLHVGLENDIDEHITLQFTISDTGIGIPENKLEDLFDEFTQADASTTRKYGGTGLGLTIAKKLTEIMGGKMVVESVEGQGSKFCFTSTLEKQLDSEEFELFVSRDVHNFDIIVVDDNATFRRVVKEQLHSMGCCADEAADGATALKMLKTREMQGDPYDIAIMDLIMPGMDGETLGRKIKEDPLLTNTILVLLTTKGIRGDAKHMEEIGFSAYLTKPLKRSQLSDCLSAITFPDLLKQSKSKKRIVTRHSLEEGKKHGIRVLVADDSSINQRIMLHLLDKLGYQADAVTNGKDVIEALETRSYNLVLMDIKMPGMNGIQTTQVIRRKSPKTANCDIPIVAVSADSAEDSREECLRAGMNDYIVKPVNAGELSKVVENWVAARRD